jgi:hypothetical protein
MNMHFVLRLCFDVVVVVVFYRFGLAKMVVCERPFHWRRWVPSIRDHRRKLIRVLIFDLSGPCMGHRSSGRSARRDSSQMVCVFFCLVEISERESHNRRMRMVVVVFIYIHIYIYISCVYKGHTHTHIFECLGRCFSSLMFTSVKRETDIDVVAISPS